MPHRDFTVPTEEPKEPYTFTLAGETFTCVPVAPSGVLNDLLGGMQLDERGRHVYSPPNLISFVLGVLREEEEITVAEALERGLPVPDESADDEMILVAADDVARFQALCRDKKRVVPVQQLGEVVMWLAGELSGRPTLPSGQSRRGRT